MAFKKTKSRKCPICVAVSAERIKSEINVALAPILDEVKQTGEVPKPQDKRFEAIALQLSLSPWSLQYHLKSCLVDMEIQDQRLIELKDLAAAISTAKAEYMGSPSMSNAQAYTSMLNAFMSLAKDIEGQDDPEQTVEFIVETVVSAVTRKALASVAEQSRTLRETVKGLVAPHQRTYVDAQTNAMLQRVSSAMREALDEALQHLTSYYKVELEAKARKRMLETGSTVSPDDSSSGDAKSVH